MVLSVTNPDAAPLAVVCAVPANAAAPIAAEFATRASANAEFAVFCALLALFLPYLLYSVLNLFY